MLKPIKRLFKLIPKEKPKLGLKVRSKKAIFEREIYRLRRDVPTRRSGALILDLHGVRLHELIGKNVLDVGSGESDVAEYLRENGISAKSLDPSKFVNNKIDYPITVEELNEKDKFDVILCSFSFLYYSKESLMVRLGFYKMLKALKVNGFVSVLPAAPVNDIKFFNEDRLIRMLEKAGFVIKSNRIDGKLKIVKTASSDLNKLKKLFGFQYLPI